MAEFRIGGKVLCVKSQAAGITKRGEIYNVYGIRLCNCGALEINVGSILPEDITHSHCRHCKLSEPKGRIFWESASRFIPLEDNHELSSLTVEELLEQMEPQTV